MQEIRKLEASARERLGTGSARESRRQGQLPVSVYGGKEAPVSATIDPKTIQHDLATLRFFTHVYEMNLGGKKIRVIPRDVQRHPVTDVAMHIDFMRVKDSDKIRVHIPIHFTNEEACPGIKRGGVLNIVLHEIELNCPVGSIPEHVELDLSGLTIGHSVSINELSLPKGVAPAHPERDNILATIVAPSGLKSEEAAEGGEAESEESTAAEGDSSAS